MIQISCQNRVYQYNQEHKLGSGAFADVYKGFMIGTNEEVAVKVIKKQAMEKYGDDIIKAIGSEVNILQQISVMNNQDPCPFIVKIFDCFETSNHIYIVLEFCNDGNLLDLTKKRKQENNRLSEDECKFIIYQLMSAVAHLDKYNITHRDIKPENVFINNGVFKLGDFGFANQKEKYSEVLGTYPYMAPEFFTVGTYTKAVDVWAVGISYHELLFDELYFIGKSAFEVSENIIKKPYVIQKSHLVSPDSQEFLKKTIEKDLGQRITATQAINLPIFSEVKKDPRILKLYQKTSGEILNKIQQVRNAYFFMYSLGEMLEQQYLLNYRFEIYYLYKRALLSFLKFGDQLAQKQLPNIIQIDNQQKWNEFINHQDYINCINLLNNDRQAMTDKFQNYNLQVQWFISQNFVNEIAQIQEIVNDDLTKDLNQDLFQDSIKDAFQQSIQNFQQIPDKMSQEARNYLLIAFMFSTCMDIDSIIQKNIIDFESFQREKDTYQINDILRNIEKIKAAK